MITKTAKLARVKAVPKSSIVYADVMVSDGSVISVLGFGKYDALWSLAQRLNERGIELEGGVHHEQSHSRRVS